jgi:hypothetical protein
MDSQQEISSTEFHNFTTNSTILPPNSTILPPNSTILPLRIIQCNYCKKIFSRTDSLKRHQNICKSKADNLTETDKLKSELTEVKKYLHNILKLHKMHPKTFQKINNQLINNNNTTNNTINNNINITYVQSRALKAK